MDDAPQDDWLRAARVEALEAEVRRLQSVEDALTAQLASVQAEYEALHANFITLGMANEAYKNELREENTRLRDALSLFADPENWWIADAVNVHGFPVKVKAWMFGTEPWTEAQRALMPPATQKDWIALQQRILGKRWHPIGNNRWQHEDTGRIVEMETPAAPEADTSAPVTD